MTAMNSDGSVRRLLRRAAAWAQRVRRSPGLAVFTGVALLLSGALVWRMAMAATVTVTTTADTVDGTTTSIAALQANRGADGQISLREAVTAAINTAGGPHTVVLPAGTYSLSASALSISAAVIIQGAGSSTTNISAPPGGRVFNVTSGLTISGLTVQNGFVTTGNGGCILATGGSITATNVRFVQCAASAGAGGAIHATGTTISLASTTVQDNTTGSSHGGGLFVQNGTLIVDSSTFTNNFASTSGGAVWLTGTANASFTDTSFSSNNANSGSGGGVAMTSSGSLLLTRTAFDTNSTSGGSGGGVFASSGSTVVVNADFTGNFSSSSGGGGMSVGSSASATVTDTTFSGNQANSGGGGGIRYSGAGSLGLLRVTFSGNSTGSVGGGGLLVASGTVSGANLTFQGNFASSGGGGGVNLTSGVLSLVNATIADNSAAGGAAGIARIAGTLTLRNTIVANNIGGNCSGTIVNAGNNLDSGTSCGFGSANGSLSSSNPLLSALASNGGSTQTMALGAGSPAINAGTATSAPTTDQRGVSRVGATDIGAFEYAAPTTFAVSGTVFEDVNYGGGDGRSLAASSGTGVNGVTVELYNSSGVFVSSTTTASGGTYSFTNLSAATYHVRVVNSTVASTRSGSTASLRGVMTYRTNASSGSAVAVTDFVGGTNPALVDPGAGSSGATFNTGTGVFSAVLSGTAQSFAPVTVGSANITGIDFGFNFDTVVNTNDSGQGSLRQAITNANTLGGDASLAQSGRTAARENLVFMISSGVGSDGLRSANNYFTTSAGSYNVATIALASPLPAITSALLLDAQTQPGWSIWNGLPLIELSGAGLPNSGSTSRGFSIAATNVTVRGFILNRFWNEAIYSSASNTIIQGCRIGTNAQGDAISANSSSGVAIAGGSGHLVGGSGLAQGNLISGNRGHGVLLNGVTGAQVQNNYIGVNASDNAILGNGAAGSFSGVAVTGGSTGVVVGGTSGGERNVIEGSTGDGVSVDAGQNGIAILGNAISNNGDLGIDLGSDGLSVNDGAKPAGSANRGMDAPVITSSELNNGTLTVAGYVGSAAGQTMFANARVELFVAVADANGYGEGDIYLGFVTADGNGNFNGNVTVPWYAFFTPGSTRLTATATDASNNTSEFGPNHLYTLRLGGTVFEDVNYGGGAGRSLAASGGVAMAGATVELYRASGAYVGATTTDSAGRYLFTGLTAEGYLVRVLTSSLQSTRSGSTAGLWPVQTWRYESSWLTPAAVTDEVGGARPNVADSAAALALSWTFCSNESASPNSCAFTGTRVVRYGTDTRWTTRVATGGVSCDYNVFGDPAPFWGKSCAILDQPMHSASSVQLTSVNVSGVDFGFNFDTVVNTNDAGQGSLRQAITNANTLGGDASLAQSGRTAAIENLVFMISNGSAAAGLRSAYNFFTTSAGSYNVATIAPASALPAVSAPLVLDAQTQPGWTLNPIVELNGASAGSNGGLRLNATNSIVRGLVINRFTGAGLVLNAGGSTVAGNWIGLNAAGTAKQANSTHGIYVAGTTGHQIGGTSVAARNVLSGNADKGIRFDGGGAGSRVEGNYIGTSADGTLALGNTNGGVGLDNSASSITVGGSAAGAGNLISGNGIQGIGVSGNGHVIYGNTIGMNATRTAALANQRGIWVYVTDNTLVGGTGAGQANVIAGNTEQGVRLEPQYGSVKTTLRRNAIYGNGSLGIELMTNAGATGVTANDGALNSSFGNSAMDFPVLTAARARGNQLTASGYVGLPPGTPAFSGAQVEVFASDNSGSNGQGQTYLGSFTVAADGTFTGTTTMPVGVLRLGTRLTATATDGNGNTSEFGPNFTGLIVDFVVNHNGDSVDASVGDGLCETATAGQCTLRAALAEVNAWAAQSPAITIAFALPSCPGAGCAITPGSALPGVDRPMTIDAQTQPGWTLAPIVELIGTGAGSTHGLNISAAGSTVRGLAIGGFGQGGAFAGIYINAGNATIEGNHIGIAADGSTARRNGGVGAASGGVHVASGSGIVIGGSTPAQRNVLSGNGGAGVWAGGGTVTVIGNYIGTNAAGSVAVGNGRWGVALSGGTNHVLGGAAAGAGNVISGNVAASTGGVLINVAGVTVQGNTIGLNAAQSAALPNGDGSSTYASGIDVRGSTGALIGGTNAGEGNVIAGNAGHGVRAAAQTTRILGNRITGNLWLGIDLNGDGVTANDGAVSGAAPNNGIDHPVFGSAGYDSATRVLSVAGYVGTGSGQAVFAGARIELFASDGDSSGYGEGRNFVGTLTADGNGRFSGSVTVPGAVSFAVGSPITATATDAAGNTSEFGPNYTVTTPAALLPARFNAFETSTPALSLTGAIKTMTAGQARTLALIALDSAGTGLAPSFTGSVSLQWMDARDNAGALDAGGCRSTWVAGAGAGTASFTSGTPRLNQALTPPAVGREWRLRMTHTAGNGTVVTACSTDNFAIKPASLAVTALGSADSSTAGVGGAARSLTNSSASGGVAHRAGRPFALRARGLDAGGALAAGYDGSAAISVTGCVLPASGCTPGSLQHNGGAASLTAVAGLFSSDTMTYSEVGAITLRLADTSFAAIDAADSTPAERLIESADVTVGRFVPDRYLAAMTTSGVLGTVNAGCTASGAGYTFFGQAFGWTTAPQFSVTALNAQGATTVNWAGSLQRLDPATHVAQAMSVSGVASALSQSHGAPSLTDLGGGRARIAVPASASFALARDSAAPVASATPAFGWAATIADTSEAAVTGNGSITGSVAQAGIAFDNGGLFHTGRLALMPGHGDARRGVRLLVELQRYSSAGWVTMTEDRGCVAVSPSNVTVAGPQGVFSTAGICAAPVQAAVTTRGGRAWMSLPATPGQAPGRLMTGLNLAGSSSGPACTGAGVSASATPMNLPHLMGAWGGVATLTAEPRAALTWGRPNRDMVLSRERF